MLHFLRKIRRNMIDAGSAKRYLLYAIGEILLVMIGILLALQVNNWNEERSLRNLENELLKNISDNLIESRNNLENNILFNKKTMSAYNTISKHVDEELTYNKSLDSAFSFIAQWSDPEFTYTAYETIKTKGIDIIKNGSIKKKITEIFEQTFPFVITEAKTEWELHNSLVLPFVVENIQYLNDKTARPNNYNNLINNNEFKNLMGLKRVTRQQTIQFSEMAMQKVDSLIIAIEIELSK